MAQKKKKKKNEETRRPPIIVVLGHIDHGKTTLLDCIRETRIAAKEAGGITQNIGAYQIEIGRPDAAAKSGRTLTFIDTPGHAAFAKMRARGARVADVAVLVVAANDGVMPQTKEAIAHAKAAQIPIVVAINKIDLADANPMRVAGQLVKEGLHLESQGGDVPVVEVSAKTGQGVPELLEMVNLVADLLELKSEPKASLEAVVVESTLSPHRGPTATLIVRVGTLGVGDAICAGAIRGKVKALIDERERRLEEVLPGMPAVVLGFSEVPPVGATVVRRSAQSAKSRSEKGGPAVQSVVESSDSQDLNVVLRADTQGGLEAITASLSRMEIEEKRVRILLAGVGQITDSDIYLAQSGRGVVLGFNVGSPASVEKLSDDLGVGLRRFTIIYELLETVEKLLKGVSALEKAKIKGEGEVIRTFALHSGDVVLGVRIEAGKLKYRDKVKVMRGEEEEVICGQIRGLKIKEDEVTEAKEGSEVGVLIKPQADFRKGDRVIVV
jgi:translation initiation factor IF-2